MQRQGTRKRSTAFGLAIYATFLIAAIAWLALYQFPQSSVVELAKAPTKEADREGHFTGTIVMPGGGDGGCRQMTFDNGTGGLQEQAPQGCRSRPSNANSTEGRMNIIRESFSKK
jgi:hypothetical protein